MNRMQMTVSQKVAEKDKSNESVWSRDRRSSPG